MRVIKDNSISLLEFLFDLNFDEIIFPETPIKIVQNKDTYLTLYKIGQLSVSFQNKLHFPYSRLKLFSHHQHFKIKFFLKRKRKKRELT